MIAVIFEVEPAEGRRDAYLGRLRRREVFYGPPASEEVELRIYPGSAVMTGRFSDA